MNKNGFTTAVTKNSGGTFHAFKGNQDGPRIDFILLDQNWNVEKSSILRPRKEGKPPSDHEPVIATVKIAKNNEKIDS